MQLIPRTIGFGSKINERVGPWRFRRWNGGIKFFPRIWEIRKEMTDQWGKEYGVKRVAGGIT